LAPLRMTGNNRGKIQSFGDRSVSNPTSAGHAVSEHLIMASRLDRQ
jgi:hypothetical protein